MEFIRDFAHQKQYIIDTLEKKQVLSEFDPIFGKGKARDHVLHKCGGIKSGCPIHKLEKQYTKLCHKFIKNCIESPNGLNLQPYDEIRHIGLFRPKETPTSFLSKMKKWAIYPVEFFLKKMNSAFTHHAIYIGNNQIIERRGHGLDTLKISLLFDLTFKDIETKSEEELTFYDRCILNNSPIVKVIYPKHIRLSTCNYEEKNDCVDKDCSCCFTDECKKKRIEHIFSTQKDGYSLFHNNCEHFTSYVNTGEHKSEQVIKYVNLVKESLCFLFRIQGVNICRMTDNIISILEDDNPLLLGDWDDFFEGGEGTRRSIRKRKPCVKKSVRRNV